MKSAKLYECMDNVVMKVISDMMLNYWTISGATIATKKFCGALITMEQF